MAPRAAESRSVPALRYQRQQVLLRSKLDGVHEDRLSGAISDELWTWEQDCWLMRQWVKNRDRERIPSSHFHLSLAHHASPEERTQSAALLV